MKKLLLPAVMLIISFLVVEPRQALAIECDDQLPVGNSDLLQEYTRKCEEKIGALQSESRSLKSTISILTSKINLTNAQIRSTTEQIEKLEEEIKQLSGVITGLNSSLDDLSVVLASRMREQYMQRNPNPVIMFFASSDYNQFITQLRYLSVLQKRDKVIMKELETARVDLDHQKTEKEKKQAEVEALKKKLEEQKIISVRQQSDKQRLLFETQNSESRYQQLLAKAVAELAAIESIIAGKGVEVEVKDVSATEKIATVINGPSACSTGAHLHFEVVKDKVHRNPSDYLKSDTVVWNNQPDGPFGFGGSWDWPLNKPIKINQGYGQTAYSARYVNRSHTGIDMMGSDLEVRAVKAGKLYRGSIPCGGGTLKYVHVKHRDDGMDTFYLHVNYF